MSPNYSFPLPVSFIGFSLAAAATRENWRDKVLGRVRERAVFGRSGEVLLAAGQPWWVWGWGAGCSVLPASTGCWANQRHIMATTLPALYAGIMMTLALVAQAYLMAGGSLHIFFSKVQIGKMKCCEGVGECCCFDSSFFLLTAIAGLCGVTFGCGV